MFFAGGFVGLVVLVLWIYCIFDVISTDETLMRNLPKLLWLVIVIFLPTIGSISWLLLGRPERAGFAPGGSTYRPEPRKGQDRWGPRSRGVLAPDDDPRFLTRLNDRLNVFVTGRKTCNAVRTSSVGATRGTSSPEDDTWVHTKPGWRTREGGRTSDHLQEGDLARSGILENHKDPRFTVIARLDARLLFEAGLLPSPDRTWVGQQWVDGDSRSAVSEQVSSEMGRYAGTKPVPASAGSEEHIDSDVPFNVKVCVLDESNRLTWRGFDHEAANFREATSEVLVGDLFLRKRTPLPESVDLGIGMPCDEESQVVGCRRPDHELVGPDGFHHSIICG